MPWTPAIEPERLEALLRGSCYGSSYSDWESARRFICAALGPGSILDIGCANGFLLHCLARWSGLALEPYGIDTSEERLGAARALFPEHARHFARASVRELEGLAVLGLPERYDQVYWNVWEQWTFASADEVGCLRSAASCVRAGGRLILGFYDYDPAAIEAKLRRSEHVLERRGVRIANAPRREVLISYPAACERSAAGPG